MCGKIAARVSCVMCCQGFLTSRAEQGEKKVRLCCWEALDCQFDRMEKKWMDEALDLAAEALEAGEVPVGCVFVYNGEVIAKGRNTVNETRNATRHAELNCLDQTAEWCMENGQNFAAVMAAIKVWVTVEPCIMCASALHSMHVASVTYGCKNDRFGGHTSVLNTSLLYPEPTPMAGGLESDRAMQLLKDFYKGTNSNAPQPKVKKDTTITRPTTEWCSMTQE